MTGGRRARLRAAFRAVHRPAEALLAVRMLAFAVRARRLAHGPVPDLTDRVGPRGGHRDDDAADAVRRLLDPVLGLVPGADCLPRGLTGYRFLRRYGVPVELVFGVRDDPPAAHCWLTLDGEPYLERTDPRPVYTPMHRLGSE